MAGKFYPIGTSRLDKKEKQLCVLCASVVKKITGQRSEVGGSKDPVDVFDNFVQSVF